MGFENDWALLRFDLLSVRSVIVLMKEQRVEGRTLNTPRSDGRHFLSSSFSPATRSVLSTIDGWCTVNSFKICTLQNVFFYVQVVYSM